MKLDRRLANQRRTTIPSSGNLTLPIIVERSTALPSLPLCLLCAPCGKPAFQDCQTNRYFSLSLDVCREAKENRTLARTG